MSTDTRPHAWLLLLAAFTMGLFAVGLPYWELPYAKVSLPSSLSDTGLLILGVLALALCSFGIARLPTVILIVGGAVPVAILLRVAVDTTIDPTTHNLWPFELVIAAGIGFAVSSAGALFGSLLSGLSRRQGPA